MTPRHRPSAAGTVRPRAVRPPAVLRLFFLAAALFVHRTPAQVQPDWTATFGDSAAGIEMNDAFVAPDGTVYGIARKLPPGQRLFHVVAVTPSGQTLFTVDFAGPFEESGQLIAPRTGGGVIAAGYYEDGTGTFNLRTAAIGADGTVLWNRTFGEDSLLVMDVPTDLETAPDGSIVVAGNAHHFEGRIVLARYAPDGTPLWALRHLPFSGGWFSLRDVLLDSAGNIYGITSNSFVSDTAHGTIFKRDKDGTLLWERSLDLLPSDETGDLLLLRNDTLVAVGTHFTEGQPSTSIVCAAVTSSGAIAAYRRIPLPGAPVQQQVRAAAFLPDGRLVVLNESYRHPLRVVHTFVMDRDFVVTASDSAADPQESSALMVTGDGVLEVYRLGSALRRTVYRTVGGAFQRSGETLFDAAHRPGSRLQRVGASLFLMTPYLNLLPPFSAVRRFPLPVINGVRSGVEPSSTWTLHPPYPNPFNPSAVAEFDLPEPGTVSLTLYDALGRFVKDLGSGFRPAGRHRARVEAGGLAGGVYFVRMDAAGRTAVRRIQLLR